MSEEYIKTEVLEAAPPLYGGFWVRLLAYAVDVLFVGIACAILGLLAAFAGEETALVVSLLVLVGPFLYFAAMHASARQATYGKALVGLKVKAADGRRISFLRSLGRELAKLISAFPLMIGFLLAAFTKRKQALHDMVAATVVTRDSPGHIAVALVLTLAGVAAPFVLTVFFGTGMLMMFMGGTGPDMTAQRAKPQPVRVAKPAPPKPPAPQAKAPEAAPQAKAPTPAKPPAPAVAVAKAQTPIAKAPPPPPVTEALPPPPPPAVKAPPPPPPPPAPVVKTAPPPPPVAKVASPAPRPAPAIVPATLPVAVPAPRPASTTPGPKYGDLMTAVMYHDAAGVEELLAFGRWPDKPDSRGMTPLAAAVLLGDKASAEALLRGGADPETAWRVMREVSDPEMEALFERYRRR